MKKNARLKAEPFTTGDKLYQRRARMTLPYLVRQAHAGQPIYYSELADELNIPNSRNLNYVLGSIGRALIELEKKWNTKIPPIQCVVVNKSNDLPGDGIGWFLSTDPFNKLSSFEKRRIVKDQQSLIYTYRKWDEVLQHFNMKPVSSDLSHLLNKAREGRGGEGPEHETFKNFIATYPDVIGLPRKLAPGKTEYAFLSADRVDVLFQHGNCKIAVEVKSRISNDADILRGIFQCIKYQRLLEAEQVFFNQLVNYRVVLALECALPKELIAVKNLLGVEVIENIRF